jgi:hypothetical protein
MVGASLAYPVAVGPGWRFRLFRRPMLEELAANHKAGKLAFLGGHAHVAAPLSGARPTILLGISTAPVGFDASCGKLPTFHLDV